LHAKPQLCPPQVACALTTFVVQACPHAPQLLGSVVVSAHSVGAAVGHAVSPAPQLSVHAPPEHAGCPAPAAGPRHECPQPPQLFGSSCSSTHAVGLAEGHPLYPLLHVKAQVLAEHIGCAFATPPGHAWPHPSQFLASSVVSTQVPPHNVGVDCWQPVAHTWPAPDAAHTGSVDGHVVLHDPQ
jgi:hypothetical protein